MLKFLLSTFLLFSVLATNLAFGFPAQYEEFNKYFDCDHHRAMILIDKIKAERKKHPGKLSTIDKMFQAQLEIEIQLLKDRIDHKLEELNKRNEKLWTELYATTESKQVHSEIKNNEARIEENKQALEILKEWSSYIKR